MKIKKFDNFLNENKYPNVNIQGGDSQDTAIPDDTMRLDIINKYFPFKDVSGYTVWEQGEVNLTFDNGAMTVKGKYRTNDDTMPSILTIGDDSYEFNWHPWGQMSSIDFDTFDGEIKEIKESIGKWTLSLSHEGYALFNIGEFSSEEEALNKLSEYKICLIKGKQYDGKTIKESRISKTITIQDSKSF